MSAAHATPTLPQLSGPIFLTDGGLETTLVFLEGIDLPDFAAFPLLDHDDGRAALERYFGAYLDIAEQHDLGFVLDTATWRANADWGARLGYDAGRLGGVNERAVVHAHGLAGVRPGVRTVIDGVIGPRGDGYVIDLTMGPDEAAEYHSLQTAAFARAGADMVTAVTMTYVDEAIGITRAAAAAGLPVVISFTAETDGRLPSGATIGDAIEAVDRATDGGPAYYMVNCAHPTHFAAALPVGESSRRIKAIRANASRMSHAELDAAEELDRGDPDDLADQYRHLDDVLDDLRVVGGCCGTDHAHIAAIAGALTARRGPTNLVP